MKSNILHINVGQYSTAGIKPLNQDSHGYLQPSLHLIHTKGIAVALSDGISSSDVSQIASATAVQNFLEDFFCTPESWPVQKSGFKVIQALNSWLYAQTKKSQYRYQMDKGYIATFSAVVFKSRTAHIFHAGDSRVYKVESDYLQQLTEDHRLWVSNEQSYLSRGLGIKEQLDIDYQQLPIDIGDMFLLATDGVYEFVSEQKICHLIKENISDLEKAAAAIVELALVNGSDDNLTLQIIQIDSIPNAESQELRQQVESLSFPKRPEVNQVFECYQIIKELSVNQKSYVYLARNVDSEQKVVLKFPSVEYQHDKAFLERFLIEEWVAKKLKSPHLVKACTSDSAKRSVYTCFEYLEGQSLQQWIQDHGTASLERLRDFVAQIARGLECLHRAEILHQDLRPHNIMINQHEKLTLIDFGSVRIAGLVEVDASKDTNPTLGTAQYSAPEQILGDTSTYKSDQFSLGVIAYQLLSGKLPYGTNVAKIQNKSDLNRLTYQSLCVENKSIPIWVDEAIKKATHPNPQKRYAHISEFVYDLSYPNPKFTSKEHVPLIEKNPVMFWKVLNLIQLLLLILLLLKGAKT